MSGTPDDLLDEVLVGGDYHEALRQVAAQSEESSSKARAGAAWDQRRKTVPDPHDFGDPEPVDRVERPLQDQLVVETPSGARLPVVSEGEVAYYEDRARRYLQDHKFTTVTDLQDLDRVLSTELMLHRYDVWLALGHDYWGEPVSEKDLFRYIKEGSQTLQNLKKSMGLDKATRDKDQGADFVSWHTDVLRRAKEFMIMRDEQFTVGITIVHEIKAKLQTYRNADRIEREELGLDAEAILEWMWHDVFPRFDAVDEHFRNRAADDPAGPGQRWWRSV